ncbi:MAG: hypothetical protein ABR581_02645 [Thermoleophilaceae bacterium]
MDEDPTTQELRLEQLQRESKERDEADSTDLEEDTAQHERRADKAAYLRKKLEQRAEAERRDGRD